MASVPARPAAAVAARSTVQAAQGLLAVLGLAPSGAPTGVPSSPQQFLAGLLSLIAREIESLFGRSGPSAPAQPTVAVSATTTTTTGTTTKITWKWGTFPVIAFNPATDKLDFGWMKPSQFTVSDTTGSTVIAVVDNNHSYTLQGVTLDQLTMSNIIAKDSGTVAKWQTTLANARTAAPSLSISDAGVAEGNAGTTPISFAVNLSKASTKPVTVSYSTANGTAVAGQDYVATSGTLTFAAGVTSQTVTIGVLGDATFEPNETFTVSLSNPSGATISRGTATGTITNDDAVPPTLSIADASVTEGNAGASTMSFAVTLSKPSATSVTASYTTANGSATAGQDYVSTSGTITFAAGVVTQTVNVSVLGDTVAEPNETFTVTLSSPSGATIADGSAVGEIVNDDTVTAPGTTAQWGNAYFAPYADVTLWPTPSLLQLSKATGTSLMTLAFIQADANGKAAWAGQPALELGSTNSQAIAINQSIAGLKAAGGDVMISFGGPLGTSLAQSYSARGLSAQALADAYAGVMTTYNVTHLDFDVESAALTDATSIALQSQALRLLQQAHPDVQIWYTIPVLPTGLTTDGLNLVNAALKAGVTLAGVNVMAMDYGSSAAPTTGANAKTMGAYAIAAAQSTYAQLTPLYSKYGQNFSWSQMGVTPMLGVNDFTDEVFTLADTQALEDFARANGIGMLSMWSVNRDNPGTLGQATPNASGLSAPAGSFSNILNDYGTINVVDYGSLV